MPQYQTYKIQPGDTISDVLYYRFGLSPVYGKGGYISQAIELNPGLLDALGNFVKVGIEIRIPNLKIVSDAMPASPETASVPILKPIAISEKENSPVEQVPTERESISASSRKPALEAHVTSQESDPNDFKPKSHVTISLGGSYTALSGIDSSNGTSGRIISDLGQTLRGSWQQLWSEEFVTGLFFNFSRTTYRPEKNGIDISGSEHASTGFGVEFAYSPSGMFNYRFGLETRQSSFYRAISTEQLEIFQIPLLRLHPELEFTILNKKPLKMTGGFGLS